VFGGELHLWGTHLLAKTLWQPLQHDLFSSHVFFTDVISLQPCREAGQMGHNQLVIPAVCDAVHTDGHLVSHRPVG
jgi:hypothetical protein